MILTKKKNPALTVIVALGSFLLLTSAFYPIGSLSVFDAKRILQLVLFATVLLFTISWPPLRRATVTQLTRLSALNYLLLALFFSIGILSSLRLEHPAYALLDVSMLFVMMVLITVTAGSRELAARRFDKWAVLLLAAMGFAIAIQEFMGFVAGWVLGAEFSYAEALMHFAHPRFYNQLQTWSIPVLAAIPLLFPTKRWVKLICISLLGLQWFLVIALAARGTTLSLLLAMMFIALWLPKQRKHWLKFQLAGLLAGIVVYACILFLNETLIPQSQSGDFYAHSLGRPMAHTSGRSTLWRLSIEDAVKQPALGSGPTRYACESEIILPAHPHSFPLRILGEWGVIAFLLILIFTGAMGLHFIKSIKHQNKTSKTDPALKAILATSLIAGTLHACLSGLLIMPASQVAMIIIAGWALSLSANTRAQFSGAASLLVIIGALIASAILVFATIEVTKLPERTPYAEDYGPMMPRFWLNGRVCEYNYSPSNAHK